MSELGELLKKLRGKESLRDAAKRAGISHTYLSIVEKGFDLRSGSPVKPTPETLKSLAKAYDYPYEELLIKAGYIEPDLDEGDKSAQEVISMLNKEAQRMGLSPSDPIFKKMLSDAFDILRLARGNNED